MALAGGAWFAGASHKPEGSGCLSGTARRDPGLVLATSRLAAVKLADGGVDRGSGRKIG